jgi:hypothetical protein
MGYEQSIASEQRLWKSQPLMREYFFFGINFMAGLCSVSDMQSANTGKRLHTA